MITHPRFKTDMNSIVSSSAATKSHHLLHQSQTFQEEKKKQSAFYCYEIGKKGNKLNQIRTSKGSIQIWKFLISICSLPVKHWDIFLQICCHPLLPLLLFQFFTQILSILHVKGSLSAQKVGKTTVEKRSRMTAQIQNRKVNHCSTG